MTLDTVTNVWLEPGADFKKQFLEHGEQATFDFAFVRPKRLPIGEKGVGRFGAHKIGSKVELITRSSEETGGVVIEWEPIGYLVRTDRNGKTDNQLRVYAKVSGIKDRNIDVDGSIVSTNLVELNEMSKILGWENPIGRRITELVKDRFTNHAGNALELHKEASELLMGIRPLIEKYGEMNFIGSYAWETMYDRDVDIELWLQPDELKMVQKELVGDLLNLDNVYEIKTRDLISFHNNFKGGRNLKCILIMLKAFHENGKLWNLDVCLFDKTDENNNALPFSREILMKLQNLSNEQKQLVVDIKKAVTSSGLYLKGRSSVDIYLRILENGVKSPEEYMPYAYELAKLARDAPKSR